MNVTIASGKGGTGKTFVATHLANMLARKGKQVTYVDADVEAPNGHLFLHPDLVEKKTSNRMVPFLPKGSCTGCGDCQSVCAFNALLVLGQQITFFEDLCHGCGACLLACEQHFLSEKHVATGNIQWNATASLSFVQGTLHVGEPRATPLIRDVLQTAVSLSSPGHIIVVDSPPGTSCSAVAAIEHADLVILVAEPTRLGLHDFKRALEMCQVVKKEVALVINRSDLGTDELRTYAEQNDIVIWAEIPYSQRIAALGTQGEMLVDETNPLFQPFVELARRVPHRPPSYKCSQGDTK